MLCRTCGCAQSRTPKYAPVAQSSFSSPNSYLRSQMEVPWSKLAFLFGHIQGVCSLHKSRVLLVSLASPPSNVEDSGYATLGFVELAFLFGHIQGVCSLHKSRVLLVSLVSPPSNVDKRICVVRLCKAAIFLAHVRLVRSCRPILVLLA